MDKELQDVVDAMDAGEREKLEVSRRRALATVAKLGLGSAALGAALKAGDLGGALAETRADARTGVLPRGNYHFVFVNHVTTNPFFAPTKVGAQDACSLLGCTYSWEGSQNSIASEMSSAVQTAANSGAAGIAVALVSPTLNTPVANALARGIPVVAYNADDPTSKRMSYIGQDLTLSGFKMGQRIAANVPRGSHVVIFIATPGQSNIQPRVDGAKRALAASGKSIKVSVITSGADVPGEHAKVESYYLGNKDVKGMFAVDGGSTEGVALTSKKHGLQKHGVYTGGYDLVVGTLNGIASGDMGFTIDQQPYLQGFYPILQLFLYKVSGGLMFPSDTNTGLKFVTKANIAPYLGHSHFE